MLSNLGGPIQHFRAAIVEAWRNKVSADLRVRKGFRGGLGWILMVHRSSLSLAMSGREIGDISEVSGVGSVWNGVALVVLMVMDTLLRNVLILLWFRSVNILSFMVLSLLGLGVLCGMVGCLCSLV